VTSLRKRVSEHPRSGQVEGVGERESGSAHGADFGTYTEKLKNLSRSPQESRSLLRQGARSEKFELIAAEKADSTTHYLVTKMCARLGVSTSGIYDHHNAVEADRAQRCANIIIDVQAAYRPSPPGALQ
jgi:hypothetical protein